MKFVEFAFSMLLTVAAVAFGFGCALAMASIGLRSVMSAIARNSYNVTSVPDRRAVGIGSCLGSDVRGCSEAVGR